MNNYKYLFFLLAF